VQLNATAAPTETPCTALPGHLPQSSKLGLLRCLISTH